MRQIRNTSVRKWAEFQKVAVPASFSEWCPHCNEKVTFSTSNHLHDARQACVSASCNCPGCGHHVGVWSFGANGKDSARVFIYPDTGGPRTPRDISALVSESLNRSYISTVEAYNAGNYVATAVCCRRTLEGIFQALMPAGENPGTLAKAISRVAETVDLSKPIRSLADVLRQGGNLGAHFNAEKEPDEEMALQMLNLLENLIEFLHVLPQEISSLEKRLDEGA